MRSKYFIPAATMIAGLIVWVVLIVLHETVDAVGKHPLKLGAGLCLVAGGLIARSGLRCRQVNGPRLGNIVRTGLLIVMAAVTWWRIGAIAAIVLLVAAVVTGVLALMGSRPEGKKSDTE